MTDMYSVVETCVFDGRIVNRIAFELSLEGSRSAIGRLGAALILCRAQLHQSYCLAPDRLPSRSVSVFCAISLPEPLFRRFVLEIGPGVEIKPPTEAAPATTGMVVEPRRRER